ncbi:MAG: UPF0236 family transposase-like protein, partial [Bacillota bacterium]
MILGNTSQRLPQRCHYDSSGRHCTNQALIPKRFSLRFSVSANKKWRHCWLFGLPGGQKRPSAVEVRIEVKRRYYRDRETGEGKFLLDEALGLEPRQRLSPWLRELAGK